MAVRISPMSSAKRCCDRKPVIEEAGVEVDLAERKEVGNDLPKLGVAEHDLELDARSKVAVWVAAAKAVVIRKSVGQQCLWRFRLRSPAPSQIRK
jgi:hypothetical protein